MYFSLLIISKNYIMLSFFRRLFGLRVLPKHESINWMYFYFNSLGEKVKCIIFEELNLDGYVIIYNENKCRLKIKRSELFMIDDFGLDEHRFI